MTCCGQDGGLAVRMTPAQRAPDFPIGRFGPT